MCPCRCCPCKCQSASTKHMACLPVVPRWLLNSRAGLAGLTNGFHAFRMSKSTYPCVAWRSRPPFLFTRARRVVHLAANHALPTLYYRREFADAGADIDGGADSGSRHRRVQARQSCPERRQFDHSRVVWGKRHYDRDSKRSSIILLASATMSSLRLFSRLVGLSGNAEVEPGE